jgi:DNA-binding NtrC family response regulator
MPGLNGLETYRKIHEMYSQSCVVMMTGYAVDEILEQAKQEGVYGVIRKPFAIDEIQEIINKVPRDKKSIPLRILVLDDDEAVLSFFSSFLESKMQKCKISRTIQEAMSAIKEERFDLVFLDLVLKDADGLSVYKEMKKLLPEAAIVVITGYIQKAKEIESEISGCLYKPFEIDKIMEYIEKVKTSKK